MPTRVHDTDFFPVVIGFLFGGKGYIDFFRHRQGIHVGAQGDHRARFRATQQTDDARVRDARLDFQAEDAQMFRYQFGRTKFTIAQFRVRMQVASPGNYFWLEA